MSRVKPKQRLLFGDRSKLNWSTFLKNREIGLKPQIGYDDEIAHTLYQKLNTYTEETPDEEARSLGTGIFNLEFSLDGHLMVAACENKSVIIYDAFNHKSLYTMQSAHNNCVNCVKFINDRLFATCSDDNSIKLWDIRKLTSPNKTLHAHSNWVKNIEYSEKDNIMVTSAFDGSIYSWDLNSKTENSFDRDKLFLMNGLMRTKLSPDSSQMIISTTSGYLIIIHDLDLKTLADDLRTFNPMIYRLMQTSGQNFPAGSIFNYLFHTNRQRNRLEFIDDFPYEAEMISSLQIHPHGWNAVSRGLSAKDTSEMTCVHDIQKRNENVFSYIQEDWNNIEYVNDVSYSETVNDLWASYLNHTDYLRISEGSNMQITDNYIQVINTGLISKKDYEEYRQHINKNKNKVVQTLPRLTHFIDEKNVGQGFIKELSYSRDGRVICSPYGKGVRILGFSKSSQELTYCVSDDPKELVTLLEMNNYHKGVVVSCKFSPVSMELVSGCLKGDIVWYKPVL